MNFIYLICPTFVFTSILKYKHTTKRLIPKSNDTSTSDIFTSLFTYRIGSPKKTFRYVHNFNCHVMTGDF